MGRTFQSAGDTASAAIFIVLAMGPCWAFEVMTLDSPSPAGTALGASTSDPCLVFWNESTLDIFAATLDSGHTLVIVQHVARLTEAA